MRVVIIDYGAGNVFSVEQAFCRLGAETLVSADPEIIRSSERVIFPGVGHAFQAMKQLRSTGLDQLIPALQQPVLGICLGMQLLCRSTEEGNTNGLSVFRSDVEAFSADLIVPHMGWNDVFFQEDVKEIFYFVHSFKATLSEDTIGVCSYGESFSAVLKRDNFLGVQFHPEKSGEVGEQFLRNFLNQSSNNQWKL
jgi:imidazole glycerol-phosphate synthase subunit HisH